MKEYDSLKYVVSNKFSQMKGTVLESYMPRKGYSARVVNPYSMDINENLELITRFNLERVKFLLDHGWKIVSETELYPLIIFEKPNRELC